MTGKKFCPKIKDGLTSPLFDLRQLNSPFGKKLFFRTPYPLIKTKQIVQSIAYTNDKPLLVKFNKEKNNKKATLRTTQFFLDKAFFQRPFTSPLFLKRKMRKNGNLSAKNVIFSWVIFDHFFFEYLMNICY